MKNVRHQNRDIGCGLEADQVGKALSNRKDFNLLLKLSTDGAVLILSGNEFQSLGARYIKLLFNCAFDLFILWSKKGVASSLVSGFNILVALDDV